MEKKTGFTLTELLIAMLIGCILAVAVYRALTSQAIKEKTFAAKVYLERSVKPTVEQMASTISGGAFNPMGVPYSLDDISKRINFTCVKPQKLFFTSDHLGMVNGVLTQDNPDGKIESLPSVCPDKDNPCNCNPSAWDSADEREVTMYEFRLDPDMDPSKPRPYILYKNVRGKKNGVPMLKNIIRGKFEYFEKDPATGKFDKPFVLSSDYSNICDLRMIKISMVVRSDSPIKGFKNETFVPDPSDEAREKALVHASVGDYLTFEIIREIRLRNRGRMLLNKSGPSPKYVNLCVPPESP